MKEAIVAFGFPDILFQPEDGFKRILARQTQTGADVVLGLFPTAQPQKAGMVDFDSTGRVSLIVEKPSQSNLKYMWAIAVWAPTFTEFLHQYVANLKKINHTNVPELPIGNVIQAAIEFGMHVDTEVFKDGSYLDIGTPSDLMLAVQQLSSS